MIKFSEYFYTITDDELDKYRRDISKARKENAKQKLEKKKFKKSTSKKK